MWLNKREQKIYDVGFLIGFWVGEGTTSFYMGAYNATQFRIEMSQQEKDVLLNVQEILKEQGIKTKLYMKDETGRKSPLYSLYLNHGAFDAMLELLIKYPLYSKKREKRVNQFYEEWQKHKEAIKCKKTK